MGTGLTPISKDVAGTPETGGIRGAIAAHNQEILSRIKNPNAFFLPRTDLALPLTVKNISENDYFDHDLLNQAEAVAEESQAVVRLGGMYEQAREQFGWREEQFSSLEFKRLSPDEGFALLAKTETQEEFDDGKITPRFTETETGGLRMTVRRGTSGEREAEMTLDWIKDKADNKLELIGALMALRFDKGKRQIEVGVDGFFGRMNFLKVADYASGSMSNLVNEFRKLMNWNTPKNDNVTHVEINSTDHKGELLAAQGFLNNLIRDFGSTVNRGFNVLTVAGGMITEGQMEIKPMGESEKILLPKI